MDPRVKAKWVAALRSGRYSQGRGDLINSDGHCCLGVLAEEMWPEFVEQPNLDPEEHERFAYGAVLTQGKQCPGIIPDDLAVMVGLGYKEQERLTEMNDGGHWSFHRIADWIEQYL